jgi:Galactose oxidase, central domain
MKPPVRAARTRRSACLPDLLPKLALLFLGATCSKTEEAVYNLEIKGPPMAFAGATTASLFVKDKEVSKTAVSGTGPFSLEVSGIDPLIDASAIFAVKAFDKDNNLVAYGQTPEIEILPSPTTVRVFVQRPLSLERTTDLPVKMKDHLAFRVDTDFDQRTLSTTVSAPVFGFGTTDGPLPSSVFYVYNPILHEVQRIGEVGNPRVGSAAFAVGTTIYVFGGKALPGEAPLARLDLISVGRPRITDFAVINTAGVQLTDPALTRSDAVLASGGPTRRLVVGGRAPDGTPVASILAIDDSATGINVTDTLVAMKAPRVGHTVTMDPTAVTDLPNGIDESLGRVLIYGGATVPGAAVAELFNPKKTEWMALPSPGPAGATGSIHPGTARKDHQAVILPARTEGGHLQILIIGGRDDANVVREDAILAIPGEPVMEKKFATTTMKLQTARADFAAFVLKDDLVVVGGVGRDGQPVATAEVFDAKTLAPLAVLPAVPRARPTATTLNNFSAIIVGGEVGGAPVGAVEIYQPRRTN